ncbi:S8 family serine peptidase [Actinoplanes sp. TBRC 11911]|uniref:S8 family serine peptidase n=1 Tax=Actinoplanes sp. TBRC 11911 TaxID=2729386 RepID=UPI00145D6E61|nr:S8 family serine peptidase [Actinoplanes sp. TBRC 11911]NMO54036.1 S8 family serine peptidase [Actinoplanes sp. TBRC 11911]
MVVRSLVLGLVAAGLAGSSAGWAGIPAAAAPPTTQGTSVTQGPPGPSIDRTVTLLSGDRVTVHPNGTGCATVTIRPARPGSVISQSCGPDGHVRVVPARMAGQIGSVLDPALFDVTTLVTEGYDDAHTADLPVIVQRPANVRAMALPSGITTTRDLPSIGATAGRLAKPQQNDQKAQKAQATTYGPGKIWLDRKVHATATTAGDLDANLSQIDAPQAWSKGLTGRGAKVAVLDSGADFSHPDLAGQVAGKADFTTVNGDAVDHFGHGTHVAATIAGTGAASHGARQGVAPGARLLIGKVLDDSGSGSDSQIIAGMEWASTRADVINMSLGGNFADDGTGPLSQAVNALTEQTGALFVIAAGNAGGVRSVSEPGSAADALTVGAVDAHDQLAGFSSHGPLVGTAAPKPEIVAPGVDIVAARAAGTALGPIIDARYVESSGTSMATPHVAGAAAVLVQRHPDWTAARLKAALVGSADPLQGQDAYAVGAGRLDVARAAGATVADQGVIALGTTGTRATLSWSSDAHPAEKLKLSVEGAAKLSTNHVKSGQKAEIAVVRGKPGFQAATVTARTDDGTYISTTPILYYTEPASHNLTIKTAATMPGDTLVNVSVANMDDLTMYAGGDFVQAGEDVTLRVPDGTYSVMASYFSYDPETGAQAGASIGDPDVRVRDDLTFDAAPAKGRPVTADVSGVATTQRATAVTFLHTPKSGPAFYESVTANGAPLVATPMRRPGTGKLRTFTSFSLAGPGVAYDLVRELPAGDDPAYHVSRGEQAKLARVDEQFHYLDLDTMVTQHDRYAYGPYDIGLLQIYSDQPATHRVDYLSPGVTYQDDGIYGGLRARQARRTYAPGSRQTQIWARQPLHSDFADGAVDPTTCNEPPSRTRGNLHVDMVLLTDQHGRQDCLAGGSIGITRTMALYRDGTLVRRVDGSREDFAVPPGRADYRLTLDVDTSLLLPFSTRVSTAWGFRSAGPEGLDRAPLPLLAVDYALALDAANKPVGGPATFTVRQAAGTQRQRVTAFSVQASLDGGVTWHPVHVSASAGGFAATLPDGPSVSLKVHASGDAGSSIDQTILDAYRK